MAGAHGHLPVRGRRLRASARPALPAPGSLARLRVGSFGRAYALAAAVVGVLILYLVQSAHVTQTSYELDRLQAQQADLLAERDQLRYQEASLRAPARVEQEAQQADMRRAAPVRYLPYQEVALDTHASVEPGPAEAPLWEQAVAALAGIFDTGQGAADER
jgi:cell division protein FtsL